MRRRLATMIILFVGLLGLGLPVAAIAYSSLAAAPSPQITMVSIVNGAGMNSGSQGFSPSTVTVVIGVNNTVTWTDNDNTMDAMGYTPNHTVSALDNSWGSSSLSYGDKYTYTFTTPGTYQYHCQIHYWMTGTVVVIGAAGSSSTSTTSTTTSTPAPQFPLPFVTLLGVLAAFAVVYRLATDGRATVPGANSP